MRSRRQRQRQRQAETRQRRIAAVLLVCGLALLFSEVQASFDYNNTPPANDTPSPSRPPVVNPPPPGPVDPGPGTCSSDTLLGEQDEMADQATDSGVRLGDGTPTIASADSYAPGFVAFDHSRTFSGRSTHATTQDVWAGGAPDCHLLEDGTDIEAHVDARYTTTFEQSGSDYTSPAGSPWNLEHKTADDEFHLCNDETGELLIFHDFDGNNTDGKIKERTTLQWDDSKTGCTFDYDVNGRLITATGPTGSSMTVDYTYSGDDLTAVDTPSGSDVDYTYKAGGHHADTGPAGALVGLEASGGSRPTRNTQYRYHSDGKLKAVYSPAAIQRLLADNSNLSTLADVLAKADSYSTGGSAPIEDFAAQTFAYHASNTSTSSVNTAWTTGENLQSKYGGSNLDETDFVSVETLRNGAGGGCCGGSGDGVEKRFYYMTNSGHTAGNTNSVERIIVEDTVDSAGSAAYRKVTGVNESGRLLRSVLIDDPTAGSPKYWCQSWKVDTDGRVTEYRQVSAHSVDSDADVAKFLDGHAGTNDGDTLHDSSGVIHTYTHNSDGKQTETKVQEGENGTAYFVSATDYYGGTNAHRMYLVTANYRYPTKTTTKTSGEKTEYTYTFWTGTDTIKTMKTTLPVVATSQNGSGVATESWQYFDDLGRLRWTEDGEGYINYYSYHPTLSTQAYMIVDADPASLPSDASNNSTKWITPSDGQASSNKPTRDSGLPPELELVTSSEFNADGMQTLRVDAGGAEHYTVYDEETVLQFPFWDENGILLSKSLLPIQVRSTDTAGRVLEEYSVRPNQVLLSGTKPAGLKTSTDQSDYVTWTRYDYDDLSGQLDSMDRYHDVPSSGNGTLDTHYYRTAYTYDDLGRRETTVEVVSGTSTSSGVEQVTQQVYDVLDRVVEVKRGVSSASHNMGSSYATLPTMARATRTVYDDGDVGDGLVTHQVSYHSASSQTTNNSGTRSYYNWRGQLRGTERIYDVSDADAPSFSNLGPYDVQDVNWSGQATASATYSSRPTWTTVLTDDDYAETTSTSRKRLSISEYDDLGRVFRTKRYYLYSSGATYNRLETDRYYDRNGRLVANAPKHQAATEQAYDGAGRQYQTRIVVALNGTLYSSGEFQYQNPTPDPRHGSSNTTAMSGGNDDMIEFTQRVLDSVGNTLETHVFEEDYKNPDGLYLGGTADYIRRSVYHWYDDANRLTTTADYGCGNSSTWKYNAFTTRSSTAPTASGSDRLVTKQTYDSETGRLETVTDSEGIVTKTFYDDLGRTLFVVANHTNFTFSLGIPANTGGTDKSEDAVVQTVYNGLNQVVELIAMDRDADGNTSDNETTYYYYEDPHNASLVTHTVYPDSSSTPSAGTDLVELEYFLDGQVQYRTDQRGTKLEYQYNDRRQVSLEKVDTLGPADGSSVQSIGRTYDDIGRLDKVTSYASSTGTGTIANEIQQLYEPLHGSVKESRQDHNGSASSASPRVLYGLDGSATSGIYIDGARPQSTTYPSGKIVYAYPQNDVDDALLRVGWLRTDLRNGTLEYDPYYYYNGTSRLVQMDYRVADIYMTSDDAWGDKDYEHLDRFGRTISKFWRTYGGTARDQFDYTYDYASNVESRDIPSSLYSSNDKDHVYAYDDLHRLTNYDRGQLSGGSISSPNQEEDFTLDALGNWSNLTEKTNGSTTLNQDRGHNDANEVTDLDGVTTHVAHDAAGNMTKVPKPTSWTAHYDLKYDAWNRLTEVKDGASTVATYEYDGLNRRIVKTVGSDVEHYYYNTNWQLLEVRSGSETGTVIEAYIWHPHYVDALAARFWDSNADGDFGDTDEVQYALHDANYNVTALVDTTGAVIERYEYTPYGEVTVLDADFSDDADGASDVENPYTYTGRRFDDETGLYYYRNRYYHAEMGRFVSRDPVGYVGSRANLYEYVNSRPVVLTDPTGKAAIQTYIDACQAEYEDCVERCAPFHDPEFGGAIYNKCISDCQNKREACLPESICEDLANYCPGCTETECEKVIKKILDARGEVSWTVYWGWNTCQRWVFDYEEKLGYFNSPCVYEVRSTTWKTGGTISSRHAGISVTLCNGMEFFLDQGALGGWDHIFDEDEVPPDWIDESL